jgi:hypothetical protein
LCILHLIFSSLNSNGASPASLSGGLLGRMSHVWRKMEKN